MRSKCILFLEPRNYDFVLIASAKQRGMATVVLTFDKAEVAKINPKYAEHASSVDRIYEIGNWRDHASVVEAVASVVQERAVVGVYTNFELCLEAAAELRTAFGLPTPSPATFKVILDKYQLRGRLRDVGLSSLRSHDASVDLDAIDFSQPYMFKPRRGLDSVCVRKCRNKSDVEDAISEWENYCSSEHSDKINELYIQKSNSYFLEQYCPGELLSYEAVISRGDITTIGVTGRNLYSGNPNLELGFKFPYFPPRYQEIIDKCQKALRAIDYLHGSVHIEMLVPDEGEIEIVDFNARFAGSYVRDAINRAYDCKIDESILALACGEQLPIIDLSKPRRFCNARSYFIPRDVGTFESIEFPAGIDYVHTTCRYSPGDKPRSGRSGEDISGNFMVHGLDYDEAVRRSDYVRDHAVINGRHPLEC